MFSWKKSSAASEPMSASSTANSSTSSSSVSSDSTSKVKKAWKANEDEVKTSRPFADPLPGLEESPKYQEMETDEEKEKYEKVLEHFKNPELKLPITEKNPKTEDNKPLNSYEKSWLTKQCFLRYLRACNWNVDETISRLSNSIAWRREFGIAGGEFESLTDKTVEEENKTGKQTILGFDNGSRPCLFLMSGRQNTKPSITQIQHLIFMLERCIDFMPQGQDKLALCVDFKAYPEVAIKGTNMPSVSVGKQVLHILQYHYPERLGRALFINIPLIVWGFLKICYPFVDPYTKQKISFDKPFTEFIPEKQLAVNYGGDVNFEYNHEEYWPEFIQLSEKKRENYYKRFEALGGEIGLDEWDLREVEN